MIDDGSAADILYLNAYKRTGLAESDLNPTTSPLYGFIRDHVIPKGMAKLIVTVGEHPRSSTIIVEFLIVDCPSEGFESSYLDLSPHHEIPNYRGNR